MSERSGSVRYRLIRQVCIKSRVVAGTDVCRPAIELGFAHFPERMTAFKIIEYNFSTPRFQKLLR